MADPKTTAGTRTIRVEALTRVEGEGGLHVRLCGDRVEDVQFTIFEPPRLFEALLRGRALEEVPDITARICGICPVAYQMSAVHALEAALGVTPSAEVRRLRRLLYCAEWIESHVLHMHLLHAPDFLGYESGLALARDFPDQVNRGLRLKKHGNRLLEVLGGRAIHPVNVAVGGFHRAPRADELAALVPEFEWGLQAAVEITRWVASFDFPQYERPYRMLALVHPDEYAMNEGQIVATTGETIDVADYEQHYEERHVSHSTALHSVRKLDGSCYFVGPLARVNLSLERLSPTARRLADEVGISWPCRNTFQAIVARRLGTGACLRGSTRDSPHLPTANAAASGVSVSCRQRVCGDRGTAGIDLSSLCRRCRRSGHRGQDRASTSQNQAQIEEDLRHWLPQLLDRPEPEMTLACERLVRNYDPCISCSTHFLRLTLERTPNEN